jgi:hypothetical protein
MPNAEGGELGDMVLVLGLEHQWRVRAYSHAFSLEQELCGSKVQVTRTLLPNIVEGLDVPFLFIPE